MRKDELTEKMHSEFTLTPWGEGLSLAWAVFGLITHGTPLAVALSIYEIDVAAVRPYVAEWNRLSAKQISLE